jgi:ribosomal protein S12 methylthiotransferase accessory factor
MSPERFDGTVRARTPEDTWKVLEPELERLGITRVARLTGLDYVGIPVWAATRPGALTLVTTQGKGASDVLAKVSAVLEAAELWHVEQPPPVVAYGSHHELRVPYPLEALPLRVRHEGLRHLDLDWVQGTGLVTGRSILVPADLARRRVRREPGAPEVFRVTSNGLACGNSLEEAILHALFEVIERDALERDHLIGARDRTLVDPWTVEDPYCHELIDRFLRAGLWLELALVHNPYEVPVCAAYIWSEDYPVIFAGAGCHSDPNIALSRALTEAAQSRVTRIAGTRDNMGTDEAAFASRPSQPRPSAAAPTHWTALSAGFAPPPEEFGPQMTALAQKITAVTGHEPAVVPLHDSAAYCAVKTVCPGTRERITRSITRPEVTRA